MGTAVARINRELPLTKSTDCKESSLADSNGDTFQRLVMQALQLRRIYREVFILRDIRGYDPKETAAILGINENSVARRLAKARIQLGFAGRERPDF